MDAADRQVGRKNELVPAPRLNQRSVIANAHPKAARPARQVLPKPADEFGFAPKHVIKLSPDPEVARS